MVNRWAVLWLGSFETFSSFVFVGSTPPLSCSVKRRGSEPTLRIACWISVYCLQSEGAVDPGGSLRHKSRLLYHASGSLKVLVGAATTGVVMVLLAPSLNCVCVEGCILHPHPHPEVFASAWLGSICHACPCTWRVAGGVSVPFSTECHKGTRPSDSPLRLCSPLVRYSSLLNHSYTLSLSLFFLLFS